MKKTIPELKSKVEGIKSRLDEAEDQISELEDNAEKTSPKEQEKEKRMKMNEEGLRELQENMKPNNIPIIEMPEGEEEEQMIENLFEKVVMENFPNLMTEEATHIQETQSPKEQEPKEAHSKTHYN